MNFKAVVRLLSYMMIFLVLLMLFPTIVAVIYKEKDALLAFIVTEIIILFSSITALFVIGKDLRHTVSSKDSYLFVTLTWVIATAFGSLPLYLTGTFDSYAKCYFEIMSGFTTTGATALTSIEDKARSILFWRSMTNWLGGMGIVVLFVAVLPLLGVNGAPLVNAESVGPTKDKLTPKIQHTAMYLWLIYMGFSLLEVLFLLFGGLDLYDSITVTFATMAAGGFCVKNASIGHFNSAYVDVVVTIFMAIAGANFAIFFKLFQRRFKRVIKDRELKVYLSIIVIFSLSSAIILFTKGVYNGFLTALRYSAFHTVSIITTTGFATCDYTLWPTASRMLLFILFFVGGCAGSAGGGIKVIRVSTMMMCARRAISKRLHPKQIIHYRLGDDVMSSDTVLAIAGFICLYLLTGLLGSFIFSLQGYDFETSLSAALLLVGNIGIGFGKVSPVGNFSIFHDSILSVGSFLMLVGRLEIYTVYALFTKAFWKR